MNIDAAMVLSVSHVLGTSTIVCRPGGGFCVTHRDHDGAEMLVVERATLAAAVSEVTAVGVGAWRDFAAEHGIAVAS